MYDRNVEFPNRYQLVKVPGTDDIYDVIPAPGRVDNDGTFINKSSLLTDATAALYGMGADAVPDDVSRLLSRFNSALGNEYLWEKTIVTPTYVEVKGSYSQRGIYNSYGPSGKAIQINQTDGSITIAEAIDAMPFTSTYEYFWREQVPFYVQFEEETFYVDGDVVSSGSAAINFSKVTTVTTELQNIKQSFGYVNSPDPNAYPINDGYTYTPLGMFGEKARIETGSYVGTGTYGESNPNRLAFGFEPKVFIVISSSSGNAAAVGVNPHGVMSSWQGQNQKTAMQMTWGKTLSWYASSAQYQSNVSETVYTYCAIG